MKVLYLFRGVSCAGKTFAAFSLVDHVYSCDDFFMVDGEYRFDPKLLPQAHEKCQNDVIDAMIAGVEQIAVANTFTREWEMENYFQLAAKCGYKVVSLIVENRHGHENTHGVPEDKVQEMRDRFEVKL